MYSLVLLALLLVPFGGFAQDRPESSSFTDPNTAIMFQVSEHAGSGMKFGLALPKAPGKDFIGFFSGGVEEVPWAGASIGGPGMLNNILVFAFPHSAAGSPATPKNCRMPLGDIRIATGYLPNEITPYNGSSGVTVQNKPIEKGVTVKDNNWQYTFLCQNCLANSSLAFDLKADKVELTYVVGPQPPSDHVRGTTLVAHTDRSTLSFSVNLSAAKSEKFDGWAKMAKDPEPCK